MGRYYTFACRRRRTRQKAENLTPAERLKFGKPLRAKPGVGPLSDFSPLHPSHEYSKSEGQVCYANWRNRGLHRTACAG